MKNAFNKIYGTKKTFLPYFIVIMVLEVVKNILNFTQSFDNIHWTVFGGSILIIGLMIALFILNIKNKYKASRVIISCIFFIMIITTVAYLFLNYPKSPSQSYASFVFYILYCALLVCLYLVGLVLHTHLNEKTDNQTLFALQILGAIATILTLIFVIYECVYLGKNKYSAIGLINLFNDLSYLFVILFAVTLETNCLPTISAQLDKKEAQSKK